jgi:hypothetical protein
VSTTNPTFGAQVLGQTEKALNAILDRRLAGTGLTEHQWITLSLTLAAGGTVDRDELVRRAVDGLKVSEAQAQALVDELAAAQLLEATDSGGATVTDAGQRLHARILAGITEFTQRMWGDLAAEDLATTGRVLSTILERANAELAAA